MHTVNVDQMSEGQVVNQEQRPRPLPPPLALDPGSIVTIRMQGHTRSPNHAEYFAPAIVLAQHDPNGEIEVLVFDSTAGTHYNPAYQIREIGTRERGDEREMYVLKENVGDVLFSPLKFQSMCDRTEVLMDMIAHLQKRVVMLEGKAPAQTASLDDAQRGAKAPHEKK